jgi:hypothetical protein
MHTVAERPPAAGVGWRRPAQAVGRGLGAMVLAAVLSAVAIAVSIRLSTATPLVAAGAVVVLLLCAWMVFEPRTELSLAVLMVYLAVADGYLKLKTGGSAATLARDLLLYAIVVGVLLRALVRGRELRLPPLTGWVVAWVVVVAIQVANPGGASWSHSVLSLRPHLEFVPLFFLGYQVMRTPRRLRGFLLLLLALAAVNGVVSLVQFEQTPEQLARWGPGYLTRISGTGDVSGRGFVDTQGRAHNRPFALGSDMGFGGSLGTLALPAALALLALARRRVLRVLALALSIGAVLGVATSEARVAVVGSVCAVVAFMLLAISSRNATRAVAALAVGAAVGYVVISSLASSAQPGAFDRYASIAPDRAANTAYEYRKDTLARTPQYMADIPLGAGLGSSGPGASATGGVTAGASLDAESEPTFLVIETGVAGLLVMLGLMLRLLALALVEIRRLPDGGLRLLLAGVAAPLFAVFAMGAAGITTAASPGAPYFWFAAGILAWWLHPDGRRRTELER